MRITEQGVVIVAHTIDDGIMTGIVRTPSVDVRSHHMPGSELKRNDA